MTDICGVSVQEAKFEDFQRFFKCNDVQKEYCNDKGLQFPTTCSFPPCDSCEANPKPQPSQKPGTNPLRKISIQGRNVMIDNKIFYMKGINWNPVPKGRSHPPRPKDFLNYAKKDAPMMKEAGINIVRTYATVTSKEVLQIFVEHGIRLINPINPLDDGNQIKAVVESLKDHDGIFMWGLGNEWNYNHLYSKNTFDTCAQKIREPSSIIKSIDFTLRILK